MSNHSVIEHRANYHFAKIEEDFVAICLEGEASPHCKALILAILESWTNSKREKREEPIVYMTYPQWVQAMYWQHGRNVIIESLEELEKQGLIIRKPHRFKGKDTFAYVLNVQAVQERIKALPEKANGEYLPRFNLNAFKNKRVYNQTRPISNETRVYNQTADAFNNIPFLDSGNIDSSHLDSQERVASQHSTENAHALSLTENDNHSYRHEDTRRDEEEQAYGEKIGHDFSRNHHVFNCHNWRAVHGGLEVASCADYQAAIDAGWREAPTDPDIPLVNPPASASIPGTSGESPPSGESRHSSQGPDGGAAAVGSGSEPRAPDAYAEKLRILDDWDKVNGQPEPRNRRLMAAAAALVPAHPTREELQGCRDWLPTTDNPTKPWYKLHGVGLWDIVEKLGLYRHHLALSIEPAPLADVKQPKPMDIYTAYSLDTERTDRLLAERRAKRLAREAAAQQQGGTS